MRKSTLVARSSHVAMLAGGARSFSACSQRTRGAPRPRRSDGVIYLDQAWSQADREMYYQAQQGAQVIAYDIFLNLEVANGQELFRSDANSDRYGLIPQAPNPRTNPDGLPIGLTKTVVADGRWKGETVGMTCAACHNAQLSYQGKKIRIDGGFNHTFDFMSYMFALDDAMQATLADASKFDRLATRLGASSADAKSALRKRFETDAARRARLPHHDHGHAGGLGARPHRRLQPDHQSHAGHRDGDRRELVVADGAGQAAVRVECAAGLVDAVGRQHPGPDRAQPWRNAGRIPAHGLSLQDTARRASSRRARCSPTSTRSSICWIAWRLRNGRRTCWARSTGRRRARARRCS